MAKQKLKENKLHEQIMKQLQGTCTTTQSSFPISRLVTAIYYFRVDENVAGDLNYCLL